MASNERKMMDNALKTILIPFLREHGFKGSFPHFRRKNATNIDLITFQFNKWGGSFIVELSSCSLEGVTMHWGEHIPPNKVTAHHVNERFRLGEKSRVADGNWFYFKKAKLEIDYEKVAINVLKLLNISDRSWISSLLKNRFFIN